MRPSPRSASMVGAVPATILARKGRGAGRRRGRRNRRSESSRKTSKGVVEPADRAGGDLAILDVLVELLYQQIELLDLLLGWLEVL